MNKELEYVWDAYNNKEYERFKEDPIEEHKRNNETNIQYSLIDFSGQSYILPQYLSFFNIHGSVMDYYKTLRAHQSHSKNYVAFNPRLKDNSRIVSMLCLHCFDIVSVPLYIVQKEMNHFKTYTSEFFKANKIYTDWRDMKRSFRKNNFDYKSLISKLSNMFEPED